MKCPNCNETLLITNRQNVEIDYCPQCRGIWLDRGELDKLLDFAASNSASQSRGDDSYERRNNDYQDRHDRSDRYDDRDRRYDGHYGKDGHRYPKKKKSFLSDFFDFD